MVLRFGGLGWLWVGVMGGCLRWLWVADARFRFVVGFLVKVDSNV